MMVRASEQEARSGSVPRGRFWGLLAILTALATVAACYGWPWVRVSRYLPPARQALERGDPAAALVPLQAAARCSSRRAEVQYLLAVVYRRLGQLDAFPGALQAARAAGWPAEDLERQEWLATAQVGEVDQVRARLLQVIESGVADDVAEEIYEALARGYLTSYRLRDAWQCLDMWLRWRPDAPQARLMRAYIYDQLDQVPAAIADYRAALELLPDDREAHYKLADLLLRQGALEEAEGHFQACLAAATSDTAAADALVGAARCVQKRGQTEAAWQYLRAAEALQPAAKQRGDVLAEMGRLLLAEGQHQEALAKLTEAARLGPAEIATQRSLAAALTRAGKAAEAKVHVDRAREIEAQYDRVGDIQRALIEKPRNADLRCEAGKILIAQGLAAKGLGWLLTAVKCDPHHAEANRLLAEYYAAAGNQTAAAQHRMLAAQAPAAQPRAKPSPSLRTPP